MIYTGINEYRVKFYKKSGTGETPILEYFSKLRDKEKSKIFKYIEFLRVNKGYLDEPCSKHIRGKIRELRVDFSPNKHRIFYFIFIKNTIIILHAFLKKTQKTPSSEIKRAEDNYIDVLNNPEFYE